MTETRTYQVNEIFTSVQGEGMFAGVRATFIRLQGCTVGCPWCDTKYTWAKGGKRMEVNDIRDQIEAEHVVITGGEPTMYNLDDLLIGLEDLKVFTQIETSGQQWFKGDRRPNWITWSPKENLKWTAPHEFYALAHEIKFVVEPVLTFSRIYDVWYDANRYHLGPVHTVLMPEGSPPSKENIELAMVYLKFAQEKNMTNVRMSDRLQYHWKVR
jgi:organic radical activating enzyme